MHLRNRKLRRASSPLPPPRTPSPSNSPPSGERFTWPGEPTPSEASSDSSHSIWSEAFLNSPTNRTMAQENPPQDTFSSAEAASLVPSFSGREGTFFKFLQMAEIAYEDVTTERDLHRFLRLVFSKLDGPAFETGRAYPAATWEALRDNLVGKYGSPKSSAELMAEFMKIKQTGTVASYGEHAQKLLVAMKQALGSEFTDEVAEAAYLAHAKYALQAFTDGLKPELGAAVRSRAPASLDAAIKLAATEDMALARCHWDKPRESRPAPVKTDPPTQTSTSTSAPQTRRQPQNPGQDTYNRFRQQNIKTEPGCSYCKEPDHHIRDCPDPGCKSSTRNQGQNPGPSQSGRTGGARRVNSLLATPNSTQRQSKGRLGGEVDALKQQLAQLTTLIATQQNNQPSPALLHNNPINYAPFSTSGSVGQNVQAGNSRAPAASGHAGATL
jgi:hypothetical protein